MKQTYALKTKADVDAAVRTIQRLPVGKLQITIEDLTTDLSDKQRRLYFMWLGEINVSQSGRKGGVEGLHQRMKERFLRPILEREDDGYRETIDALERVKTLDPSAYQNFNDVVNELTSIKGLEKQLMTEFLNDMELACAEAGILLTHPEDCYQEAMGRTKTKPGGSNE